jgi:hypothetical protein
MTKFIIFDQCSIVNNKLNDYYSFNFLGPPLYSLIEISKYNINFIVHSMCETKEKKTNIF